MGGFPYTPARPLPDRRLYFSGVYTSFSPVIGQLAVAAAEVEYSWAGAVPEHRSSYLPASPLALHLFGTRISLA